MSHTYIFPATYWYECIFGEARGKNMPKTIIQLFGKLSDMWQTAVFPLKKKHNLFIFFECKLFIPKKIENVTRFTSRNKNSVLLIWLLKQF